jgi:hypothetical protein
MLIFICLYGDAVRVPCLQTISCLFSEGSFGIVWFIMWMLLASNRPESSKRITSAEKRAISKCISEEIEAANKVLSLSVV